MGLTIYDMQLEVKAKRNGERCITLREGNSSRTIHATNLDVAVQKLRSELDAMWTGGLVINQADIDEVVNELRRLW